jgi:hypothetical protein
MHRRYRVRALSACLFMFLLLRMVAACANGSSGGARPGASNDIDGGLDASIATRSRDSGTGTGAGDTDGRSDASRGQDATTNADGGVQTDDSDAQADGGVQTDGSDADGGGADGSSGPRDIGSCCTAQGTPGCSNPDLEVCVCQKDPSCCTAVWDAPCALIVQQKYCQPTVRDCVCGADAGQWGQTQCCTTDWTSTCDSVATLKCNAVQGCF